MVMKLKTVSSMFIFIFMLSLSFSFCSDAGWIGSGSQTVRITDTPSIALTYHRVANRWDAINNQYRNSITTHYPSGSSSYTDTNYIYTYGLDELYVSDWSSGGSEANGTYSVIYPFPIGTLNSSSPFNIDENYDMIRLYIQNLSVTLGHNITNNGGNMLSTLNHFSILFNGVEYELGRNGNYNLYLPKPINTTFSIANDIILLKIYVDYSLVIGSQSEVESDIICRPIVNLTYGGSNGAIFISGVKSQEVTSIDITNQTNSIEHDYDNSSMNSDKSRIDESLNNYNSLENNINTQSFNRINQIQFTNIESSPGMLLTSISVVSSFLQSLFLNLGDWNNLILISLSITFGLMLIGWFKFRS